VLGPVAETDILQSLERACPAVGAVDAQRIRLNVWNTNPIEAARTWVRWTSRIWARSWPSKSTIPAVGRSRPPRICSRVDLPWPVGPWMDSQS
jgi:hypothetical protein